MLWIEKETVTGPSLFYSLVFLQLMFMLFFNFCNVTDTILNTIYFSIKDADLPFLKINQLVPHGYTLILYYVLLKWSSPLVLDSWNIVKIMNKLLRKNNLKITSHYFRYVTFTASVLYRDCWKETEYSLNCHNKDSSIMCYVHWYNLYVIYKLFAS